MAGIETTYTYRRSSEFCTEAQGDTLRLASDNCGNSNADRKFLDAHALFPDVTAKGLRGVSEIVGARFYIPPAMLARILREADPVVTVSPGAVRFEGFSACCSTYARLDLDDGALQILHRQNGTTNVDFGPELRGALARVRDNSVLGLTVDEGAVGVKSDTHDIVEKKVPLPTRWIKGFAEVQVVMAEMEPAFRLSRVAAQRFLRALPRGKNDQRQWVSFTAGSARISARQSDEAIALRGSHRLKILETMVNRAEAMDVYVHPTTGASAWALDFGVQRFWLVLNAEPWRGFSGDGRVLSHVATSDGDATAAIRAQLKWQDEIDICALASTTGLEVTAVEGALAELASTGLVGFDLSRKSYFHRVLPFDFAQIETLNPRLKSAEALIEQRAITLTQAGADVTSKDVIHRVSAEGDGLRCTCPWFAKNGTRRGPCKHVLAYEMFLERQS